MRNHSGFLFMDKKKKIDWEKIEVDYRAGVKTLREIADEHNITHGAINKRAKSATDGKGI